MNEQDPHPAESSPIEVALTAVRQDCARHGISVLDDFQESCREFAAERMLNIAVLGRFKAGKSSFLNHLLGHQLLPVGVAPVTSIVTEIQWGCTALAAVKFLDGRREWVSLDRINEVISEFHNLQNEKQVARVRVELTYSLFLRLRS
jgi:predicted GTPase